MTYQEKITKIIHIIKQDDVYTICLTSRDYDISRFIQRINPMIKRTFDYCYDKELEPGTFFYNAFTHEAKLHRYSEFLLQMYFKFFEMDFESFKSYYLEELRKRSDYGVQMLMKEAGIYPYNL